MTRFDPHVPTVDDAPPWYLAAPLALVNLLPVRWLGWGALGLVFALVYFLPRLDRSRGETVRERAPVIVAGLIVALFWTVLTLGGVFG